MKYKRLLIISNRLPYKPVSKKKEVELVSTSGGLVSSISSYIEKSCADKELDENISTCWIGSLDNSEMKLVSAMGQLKTDNFELEPVGIPDELYSKYYNGFCNSTIWPLFHYFPSYANYKNEEYDSFVQVNKIFAEKIKKIYQPGDLIWVHDYHLMLLPALIRQTIPGSAIGFFLHIPFPSFEVFRMLPGKWRKEILNGILGSDLIGFHTNDYLQYFVKSVNQLLGYESSMRTIATRDRSIITDTFPVSIDYAKFNMCSDNADAFSERNNFRKTFYGKKIVFSVDRLDYSKGILNRLEGFELFLNTYPEYQCKVTYMLVIVPSRDVIPKYRHNKKNIEELVSQINGKYGTIDWSPIIYLYKNLDYNQLTGLYMAADAALITPVRDGMNLVAKEFVASRGDKRGVLILSETAGASVELGEALIVNPTDRQEIAESIKTALEMPSENQIERMDIMQKRIKNYDVVKWAEDFISQLLLYKKMQEKLKVKVITATVEEEIISKYKAANKRLLLFDYDGTLSPIKSLPSQAVPSMELIELLQKLSSDERNKIVIISGRPANVLDKWFGELRLDLVAEHGAFIKANGNSWVQTIETDTVWKTSVISILNLFSDRCAGAFIEEKQLSVAWHYRNVEQELGFTRSRELINSLMELVPNLGFQVLEGKKVIEARARGIDKGAAALNWLAEYRDEFILAAGDDKTDEDLFKVIPFGGYTIRIGLDQSVARYNYPNNENFLTLLKSFSVSPLTAAH